MWNVELVEKLQKHDKCHMIEGMHGKKPNYKIFKRKMHIVESLVNDAQALIPTGDIQSAKRLVTSAKFLLPSDYLLAKARREAPLMMALRGENSKSSKVAIYANVINELGTELDGLLRKRYFPSRRNSKDHAA